MSEFEVTLLNNENDAELEHFLQKNEESTVFHTLAWHRVIKATYGHDVDYWVAWSGRQIVGVFPVVVVKHPILGTKMVAMAYQMHSGLPLASSETIKIKLVERALVKAHDSGAKYLEIRHHEPVSFLERMGFLSIDSQLVTTFSVIRDLSFSKIRRGHRRDIVKAEEQGVVIIQSDDMSDLRKFRQMYLAEGRELGAPQAGWHFFQNLYRLPSLQTRLLLALTSNNRCLGGLLTIADGQTVFARHGAYSSPEALKLHVGKALLWRAMSDASEQGCISFNLGLSWCKDTGLIRSKEGWNGTTKPVHLYAYPIRSKPPAPGNYFESYEWAKAIWRRLPLPVVDWAGQIVTRWVC